MYDPYISSSIEAEQSWPNSYWYYEFKNQDKHPLNYSKLERDLDCEVAIIGAGYTGMNCALSLSELGIESVVLEANQPGWGCAGRNAGFILPGSGRLGYSALVKKYGEEAATYCYKDYFQALESIRERIDSLDSSPDVVNSGYLKIAHNKDAADAMKKEWQRLPLEYRQQSQWVSNSDIEDKFIPGYDGYAGLFRTAGQALQPFSYAQSLAKRLLQADIPTYGNSPVIQWQQRENNHILHTPEGQVSARKVVIASNAYSPTGLHPHMVRQFPVLSSVLVTQPIPKEIANNWYPFLTAMDTRSLKYYYRLLPDNRLLFGGRGAVEGKEANTKASQLALKNAFNDYFPNLSSIDIEHFWSGWVSVAFDDIPHIGSIESDSSVFFATGYCGSGVSFATHAGKRLAQLIDGQKLEIFNSPVYKAPIPSFPFAKFRRIGLKGFYTLQKMKDKLGLD